LVDAPKPGGRRIADSSHSIVDYILRETFVVMLDAIHEYGRC